MASMMRLPLAMVSLGMALGTQGLTAAATAADAVLLSGDIQCVVTAFDALSRALTEAGLKLEGDVCGSYDSAEPGRCVTRQGTTRRERGRGRCVRCRHANWQEYWQYSH